MSFFPNSIRALAVASVLLLAAPAAFAAVGACGQPLSFVAPTTRDALYVLRAAVGSEQCEPCVCDVDSSSVVVATDALSVLKAAVGLETVLNCPLCTGIDLECPSVVQFTLFAKIRGACTTNAECAVFSTCDTSIGRCRTGTDSDVGWNGLAHEADIDDPIPSRLFLDCEGPAPCGECLITGHDPSLGNCRCRNDNRQVCFEVAAPDQQFCGGDRCVCYFGPPMPLSSGNTPVCVANSLRAQPSGQANVDEGSGVTHMPLNEIIFLGESLLKPCPVCVDDPNPANGVREGVCQGGLNDGQSCDAQGSNFTFPPPTGARYSLDCFPLPGADISDGGLPLTVDLSTGTSQLDATLPCATEGPGAELNCPCRVCSGDAKVACSSDAECAAVGAGTCSSDGGGEATRPNGCSDGVCESVGDNHGRCATGPDDTWCDAIVRPDGAGLVGCGSNADCAPENIGVDAGTCTLVTRRPCFLDPIVSQGQPHPVIPLGSGPYCLAASSSEAVNSAAGLPGPGRLTLQTHATTFCGSNVEVPYTPGVGGCPEPGAE